jgi:hypothetical protein
MNKVLSVILVWIFSFCAIFAQGGDSLVLDPEVDFINSSEAVCAEFGIIKKDEVVRLDLDVNNTASPVVFLSFNGTGSNSGSVWAAYIKGVDGYRRIDGIQFREDFLRAGKVDELNPAGGLVVLYPGKGGGNLARYQFVNGKAKFDEIRTLDYSNEEDQRLFESIFKRKLGEPMSAEYFAHPPHKVIPVKDIVERASKAKTLKAPSIQVSPASPAVPNEPAPILSIPTPTSTKTESVPTERSSVIEPGKVTNRRWPWIVGVVALVLTSVLWMKRGR